MNIVRYIIFSKLALSIPVLSFSVRFLQNQINEHHLDPISLLKQKLDGSGFLKSGSGSEKKPGSIWIREVELKKGKMEPIINIFYTIYIYSSSWSLLFKVAVSRDLLAFFISLIQPTWASDQQVKTVPVSLKNSFSRRYSRNKWLRGG